MSGWETYYVAHSPTGQSAVKRRRFSNYADVLSWTGPTPEHKLPSLPAAVLPLAQALGGPTGRMLLWNDGIIEDDAPEVRGLPVIPVESLLTLSKIHVSASPGLKPSQCHDEAIALREFWLANHLQQPKGNVPYPVPPEPYQPSYKVGFTHSLLTPTKDKVMAALHCHWLIDLHHEARALKFREYVLAALALFDEEIGFTCALPMEAAHMVAFLTRVFNQAGIPTECIAVMEPADCDEVIDLYEMEDLANPTAFSHLLPVDAVLTLWETVPGDTLEDFPILNEPRQARLSN